MSLSPHNALHTAHEWRLLLGLLEYFEGLPSNVLRALWLDCLQAFRPALFEALLQLLEMRARADACGFMRVSPITPALLRMPMRIDSLACEFHQDV